MEYRVWGWDISFDLPIYYSEIKDQLSSCKKPIKYLLGNTVASFPVTFVRMCE